AVVFALGWVPAYLFRAESVGAALPMYTPRERVWVWATMAALTTHMSAACISLQFTPTIPPWRAALGVAVFAAGMALWFWGRVLIGPLHVRRMPDDPPSPLRR